MKIYINKEILTRFKEEKISLDYVGTIIIILMCLYEKNYGLLDEIDDDNKSKRLLTLYRYLDRKGLLELSENDAEDHVKVHYNLTERGVTLTNFILSYEESDLEVHKEFLNEVIETEDDVDVWIEEWLDLFPEGKFFGRALRTNKQDCLDRMKWFIKTQTYTKDVIFEATRQYIEDQRTSPEGYKFTRNSTYFICKGKGVNERISDLATECEKIKKDGIMSKDYVDRDSV